MDFLSEIDNCPARWYFFILSVVYIERFLLDFLFRLRKPEKMAPNVTEENGVLFESDAATPDLALARAPVQQADDSPRVYVWRNIILFAYLHLAAIYGGYLFLFSAKWQTDIFGKLIVLISCFICIQPRKFRSS